MPPWLSAFISPLISAGVAFAILYINHLRDKNKSEAGDEKTWRQARLDAEKALREAIAKEEKERTQWQLKNEGDLASITTILEDGAEASKLLAQIATTSQHHDGRLSRHDDEFKAVHQRLENMNNHLHQLSLTHGKHP